MLFLQPLEGLVKVGWKWANEIARKNHQTTVITRLNNKDSIENYNFHGHSTIEFRYYDLHKSLRFLKKRLPGGIYIYYILWQLYLPIFLIRNDLLRNNICYHHITFAGIWNFSLLPFIARKVIIGPIGGGEIPTLALVFSMFPKNLIKELIRILTVKIWAYSPFTWISFALADKIYVSTRETKMHLPVFIKQKVQVLSQIGSDDIFTDITQDVVATRFRTRRLLFAGRILEWKGLKLLLSSMKIAHRNDFELVIVGDGNDKSTLRQFSKDLNLDINISWVDPMPFDALIEMFSSSTILLLPSFHDSGGLVLLEAASCGVPCISLDLGGPCLSAGQIDDRLIVDTKNKSYDQICFDLYQKILFIMSDFDIYSSICIKAKSYSEQACWRNQVTKMGIY